MNYEYQEYIKRDKELCLIASENYPSESILEASGSIFQLKYAEGFPGKRFYQGTEIVDNMEQDCIDTCLKVFNAAYEYNANVQPNSGASANMIVYNAILKPGSRVLAMDVKAGGHISHSHPISFLSKYHNVESYGVNDEGWLDYDEIEKQALKFSPELIICGASNYSRVIDFKRFKEIADKCGAYLMADIAHISALVAKGLHPSPVGLADFITSTTHKSLAGPRGAFILYKKQYEKEIKLSTIPGLFGGPLEHQIYAKLKCFEEFLSISSKLYADSIIENSKCMCDALNDLGIPMVSGGSDNHLVTIDLNNYQISGKQLSTLLEECGVIVNCNTVPNDKRSFLETSGIRIGVPAITKRGLQESDCYSLFSAIGKLINNFRNTASPCILHDRKYLKSLVQVLTRQYPLKLIYPKMYERLNIK